MKYRTNREILEEVLGKEVAYNFLYDKPTNDNEICVEGFSNEEVEDVIYKLLDKISQLEDEILWLKGLERSYE
jgi:hypothetical protein